MGPDPQQDQHLSGKLAVVTGANRGLGLAITQGLAERGATVVMACRSWEKGQLARDELTSTIAPSALEVREVDLVDPASIRSFAAALLRDHPRVDVLVNNAGTMMPARELTEAGVELTFAANVLGPQLLTQLLLPGLQAAAPARVVVVASDFAGNLDLDDLQYERRRFSSLFAYRQSKQANRMLTREWARQLAPQQISVNAMSPSLVPGTDLFRHQRGVKRLAIRLLGGLMGVTVKGGADTAVWLATSPALAGETGGFYMRRLKVTCAFDDPAAERALWERCQSLLAARSD